jgi:hypothetical protein
MRFIDARKRDYEGVILPDCINILDYYNPKDGDYTKVSTELEAMAAMLNSGILIVGIQKAKGAAHARGAELSNELSQLTVHLSVKKYEKGERVATAELKMVKVSAYERAAEGKRCDYGFGDPSRGSRIIQQTEWEWGSR